MTNLLEPQLRNEIVVFVLTHFIENITNYYYLLMFLNITYNL